MIRNAISWPRVNSLRRTSHAPTPITRIPLILLISCSALELDVFARTAWNPLLMDCRCRSSHWRRAVNSAFCNLTVWMPPKISTRRDCVRDDASARARINRCVMGVIPKEIPKSNGTVSKIMSVSSGL